MNYDSKDILQKIIYGQILSAVGSGMTTFVVALVIYTQNNRAADYAILFALILLPKILSAVFSGYIVDFVNKKTLIIASDVFNSFSTLLICFVIVNDVDYRVLYLLIFLRSCLSSVQEVTFSSLITDISDAAYIKNFSGLLQLSSLLPPMVAPLLAIGILNTTLIYTLFIVDLATFALSIYYLNLSSYKFERSVETQPARRSEYRFDSTLKRLTSLLVMIGITSVVCNVYVTHYSISLYSKEFYAAIMCFGGLISLVTVKKLDFIRAVGQMYIPSILILYSISLLLLAFVKTRLSVAMPILVLFHLLPIFSSEVMGKIREYVTGGNSGKYLSVIQAISLTVSCITYVVLFLIESNLGLSTKAIFWALSLSFGVGLASAVLLVSCRSMFVVKDVIDVQSSQ